VKLEIDPSDLLILFNLASRADVAGLAGKCSGSPCPHCSALESAYMVLHRAGIKTELEILDL
jgi:hypothetical protein